jgi:hypothetical protein
MPCQTVRRHFRPRLEYLECRDLPSILTVLNNSDSGPGSLRQAIADAQSGDTINFHPSLRGRTIRPTGGELAVSKSLNIEGPGPDRLTVSGNNASRVFDVTGSGLHVTIAGLTIANGLAGSGGGIEIELATLTLSHVTLENNRAVGSAGGGNAFGGGVSNVGGTLNVSDCTFAGNRAVGGNGGTGRFTSPTSGFTITTFDVPGGTGTQVNALNNSGMAAGNYRDGTGVAHGFIRDARGTITTFDVPNSTGTDVKGLNNS